MGMLELSIWLFVLFTVGQYAVAWGSYFEKKLAVEELISSKLKKLQRKIKKKKQNEIDVQEEIEQLLTRPSYKNTLPFQIFNLIISLPSLYGWIKNRLEERKKEIEERKQREIEEAEELEREKEEMEREKERKLYRRKRTPYPEFKEYPNECILDPVDEPSTQEIVIKPVRATGPWTDDEFADLAKYMKKYPVGTPERWEKIAESLNRTVNEVTHFAKKIKDNAYKPPGVEDQPNGESQVVEEKKKEKTRGGKNLKLLVEAENSENAEKQIPGSTGWTQKQQKSLETALAVYTKGSLERWERIAKAVPEKTKEECMLRVKYLADLVKKKKQEQSENNENEQQTQDEGNHQETTE
nr:EOG090X0BHG [Polyphemus pediculus]